MGQQHSSATHSAQTQYVKYLLIARILLPQLHEALPLVPNHSTTRETANGDHTALIGFSFFFLGTEKEDPIFGTHQKFGYHCFY